VKPRRRQKLEVPFVVVDGLTNDARSAFGNLLLPCVKGLLLAVPPQLLQERNPGGRLPAQSKDALLQAHQGEGHATPHGDWPQLGDVHHCHSIEPTRSGSPATCLGTRRREARQRGQEESSLAPLRVQHESRGPAESGPADSKAPLRPY
jgi:hypothetical protein